MINTLIYILIVGVVIGIIWWVCDYMPIPEPINRIIKMLTIIIGAIVIIYALLGLAGISGGVPRLT